MSRIPEFPVSQQSAFIQSGFVNNYSNKISWSIPISKERACRERLFCEGDIVEEVDTCIPCLGPEKPVLYQENFTDTILRGVRDVGRGPARGYIEGSGRGRDRDYVDGRVGPVPERRNPLTYTRGNSDEEDLRLLGRLQGFDQCTRRLHRLRQIPRFAEPAPGVFVGTYVNDLLEPDAQPIRVTSEGEILGGYATAIIQRRIDQLNGFGETVNTYTYGPPGQPGSPGFPFIKDNFYVTYGLGTNSLWANRIFQFANPPTGYTPPTGTFDLETQGLTLFVNGCPGRIMYLRRGCTYNIHMPLQQCNPNLPCCVDGCMLDCNAGWYLTLDPIGGNYTNFINQTGNFATAPQVFPGTAVLTPGSSMWLRVDNTFPDVLFYASTMGPFQGGVVLIVGDT